MNKMKGIDTTPLINDQESKTYKVLPSGEEAPIPILYSSPLSLISLGSRSLNLLRESQHGKRCSQPISSLQTFHLYWL
jgi:hypothetical protein